MICETNYAIFYSQNGNFSLTKPTESRPKMKNLLRQQSTEKKYTMWLNKCFAHPTTPIFPWAMAQRVFSWSLIPVLLPPCCEWASNGEIYVSYLQDIYLVSLSLYQFFQACIVAHFDIVAYVDVLTRPATVVTRITTILHAKQQSTDQTNNTGFNCRYFTRFMSCLCSSSIVCERAQCETFKFWYTPHNQRWPLETFSKQRQPCGRCLNSI